MFHLGEGEDFGGGGGHGVGVAGVQQALEHHPAVVHVAVDRQVDPAEAAVRDASLHFVLPADEVAARKLGNKRVSRAALGAEALGAPGLSVPSAPDRLVAFGVAAVPAAPPAPAGRSGSRRQGRPSACAESRRSRRRGGRDCCPSSTNQCGTFAPTLCAPTEWQKRSPPSRSRRVAMRRVHRVRARYRRCRSSRRRRSRRSPVRRISFGLPPLVDDQLLVVRDGASHGTEVARSS